MTDEEMRNDDEEESLSELVSVQGEMNARVVVGLLESEGIEVMMKSQQTFSALPFTVDGMGEVKVMVRGKDLARAKEVLKEYQRGVGEDDPELGRILADLEPPGGQPH